MTGPIPRKENLSDVHSCHLKYISLKHGDIVKGLFRAFHMDAFFAIMRCEDLDAVCFFLSVFEYYDVAETDDACIDQCMPELFRTTGVEHSITFNLKTDFGVNFFKSILCPVSAQ